MTTTRKHGGTGLGLAISKPRRADGRPRRLSSEVGRGSTFWAEVPLRRGSGANSPAEAIDRSTRVLVVDDLPDARAAAGGLGRFPRRRRRTSGEQAIAAVLRADRCAADRLADAGTRQFHHPPGGSPSCTAAAPDADAGFGGIGAQR